MDPRERPQLLVLRRQVLGDRAGLQQELQLGGSVYHPVPGLCSDSSRIWLVLLGWSTAVYGERSHYESFCPYLITASKILSEKFLSKMNLQDIRNKPFQKNIRSWPSHFLGGHLDQNFGLSVSLSYRGRNTQS